MRVVIASLDYPPDITEGVARQRQLLAVGLARLGHQVHVVTRGARRESSSQDGVHVHRYTPAETTHDFLEHLPVLNRPLTESQWLAEAVRDVVVSQHADIVDVPLWLAQPLALVRQPPCPIAVWLQTSLLQLVELQGRGPRPHEQMLADIDRFVMSHAAGCIADSQSVRHEIARLYGVDALASRTVVVHPGIDVASRPARVTRVGSLEALVVGRLEQRKGTRLLLDILPRLLSRVPGLTIRFVGRDNSASDGFARDTTQTYPQAFRDRHAEVADRVFFEGYLSDEELSARYRSADLLIHPALYESFGLIFLEAMRAALPVVTFATGGALEVFSEGLSATGGVAWTDADPGGGEQGAVLVPPYDTEGFIDAVARLAADAPVRASIGEQGRQVFERRFTTEHMARDTVRAYERILGEPTRGALRPGRTFQVMEALQDRDAVSRITRTNAGILSTLGGERPVLSLVAEPAVRHETGRLRAARFTARDTAIFHYWGFSRLEGLMTRFPGRKAIHYHNITPPHFFAPRTPHYETTWRGYAQLARLAGEFDLIIGDSNYNLGEYSRHLSVARPALCLYPVVDVTALHAAAWDQAYAADLERQSDGPMWLFVGRFAPNKRQDQLMRAFDRFVGLGHRGRLVMVGDVTAVPAYVAALERLRARLPSGSRIVIVPSVSDEVLRALYRVARLFVCASEHEGFCVPIAEAMAFGVPTIALNRGAVGETVGESGVLVANWDPRVVAETALTLIESPLRRAQLAALQQLRLTAFSPEAITHRLRAVVQFLREGQSSPFFYELPARRRPVSLDRLAVPASEERHAWSTSMN